MPFPSNRGAEQRPRLPGVVSLPLDDGVVRRVYQLIYRHVGNRAEAESLTERAFERAAMAERGVDDQRDGESRLLHAARTVLTEHLRAFYPETTPRLRDDDLAERLLARLPARERDLLTLRFRRGASLEETAAALRLTTGEALAMQWSALARAGRLADDEPALAITAAGAGPCECST